jgi:hypothetical protein
MNSYFLHCYQEGTPEVGIEGSKLEVLVMLSGC